MGVASADDEDDDTSTTWTWSSSSTTDDNTPDDNTPDGDDEASAGSTTADTDESDEAADQTLTRIVSGPQTVFDVARGINLISDEGDAAAYTGAGVQVALIDTGVVDVEGLRSSNVTIGPDFSFEDPYPNLRGRDTNGHGTHMAGIIVGADAAWIAGDEARSSDRFVGVAPDAELISIKVAAHNGAVDVTQVIAAINWVIEHKDDPGMNIQVIALAYGTESHQSYLASPLAYAAERAWRAGIVVVAAGGNDGSRDKQLRSPAHNPYVIAVAAAEVTDDSHIRSSYSSDGNIMRRPDVAAPGTSVISLRAPGSFSDDFNEEGRVGERFVRGTGSSQATAVVAGAVAVLLEQRPALTPDEVKKILTTSATEPEDGSSWYELGLLDVAAALDTPTPTGTAQRHWPSRGNGSIQKDRGNTTIAIDGIPIEGEVDIFGVDHSDTRWTTDAWTGNSWSEVSWSGVTWSGFSWSGLSWSGFSWSGLWSGLSWSGLSWSGVSWSGLSWSGVSWSGVSWSGHRWE